MTYKQRIAFQAGLCKNDGFCVPDCDTEDGFRCQCTSGWEGRSCNLKVDVEFLRIMLCQTPHSLKR